MYWLLLHTFQRFVVMMYCYMLAIDVGMEFF